MLLLSPFLRSGSTFVSGVSPASHVQVPTSSSQISLCPTLPLLPWSFLLQLWCNYTLQICSTSKKRRVWESFGDKENLRWILTAALRGILVVCFNFLSIACEQQKQKKRTLLELIFFVANPIKLLCVCKLPEERSGMIHSAKKRNKYWKALGEYVYATLHCKLQLWGRVWMLLFLTVKGWQCVM